MTTELQEAIETALQAMRAHEQSVLLPYYRWAVYMALGPLPSLQTHFLRVRLALLSAKKSQYIWQNEVGDTQVEAIIHLAEKVLRDEVLREDGLVQAEAAFDHLEELATHDETANGVLVSNRAQAALHAAIQALFEASGAYTFASEADKSEGETDNDLDPWTTDAAGYASNAVAGAVWDEVQDYAARKAFWEWWLLEAIPSLYSRNDPWK